MNHQELWSRGIAIGTFADGMMGTGENLAQCHALDIELYSPSEIDMESDNPALRPDLTQPIPAEDIPKLQTTETKHRDGSTTVQFHKNAFVYDEENNCYRCPNGKSLGVCAHDK